MFLSIRRRGRHRAAWRVDEVRRDHAQPDLDDDDDGHGAGDDFVPVEDLVRGRPGRFLRLGPCRVLGGWYAHCAARRRDGLADGLSRDFRRRPAHAPLEVHQGRYRISGRGLLLGGGLPLGFGLHRDADDARARPLRLAARPLPAHTRRIRRLRIRRQGRRRQRPEHGLGVLRRRHQPHKRDGRVPHRNLNRRGRRTGHRLESRPQRGRDEA